MIRVTRQAEPVDFATVVGTPGQHALWEFLGDDRAPKRRGPKRTIYATLDAVPAAHLPSYWSGCLSAMRVLYGHTCAYFGLEIGRTATATVDHYQDKAAHKNLAYSWDNFRLSSHLANTRKGTSTDVLDPFEVDDSWFVLNFQSFRVAPATGLDASTQARVEATIARLKLNDEPLPTARREAFDLYLGVPDPSYDFPREPGTMQQLWRSSRFVAVQAHRQGQLRDGDDLASVLAASRTPLPPVHCDASASPTATSEGANGE